MKLIQLSALSLILLSNSIARCQTKTYHSIQEVVDDEIAILKGLVSHYDHIYISNSLDSTLRIPKNTFKIENSIDAKFIKKSDKNFIICLNIHTQSNHIVVDVSNASIVKLSNRKLKINYFENGRSFIIE